MMGNDPAEGPSSSMDIDDIYYVLFRHKRKIVVFFVAGIAAAAVFYFTMPPVYQSEARLLVPYVLEQEARPVNPSGTEPQIRLSDPNGGSIINSELEILKSFDLATNVADIIGPEKILARIGGGANQTKAAVVISMNVIVDAPKNSSIIRVAFRHSDREVVQPVLRQLIDSYEKKHVAIHRATGVFDEFLTQETDRRRGELVDTGDKLRKLKNEAGVISLEDSKKAIGEQTSKIQGELSTAEVELTERKAGLQELQKRQPAKSDQAKVEVTSTSWLEKTEEYKNLAAQLDSFRKKETELLSQFTVESEFVKSIRVQINTLEKRKKELEKENPLLARQSEQSSGAGAVSADPAVEEMRIKALEAKIDKLKAQLETVRKEALKVYSAEDGIVQLQLQRELQETNYRYYQASLEQSRINDRLAAGKASNIKVVQEPSPPSKDSTRTHKFMGIALAFGVFGGIGLAFLMELVLDRSVRRPKDVTAKLNLPLFMTIPYFSRNGHSPLLERGAGEGVPTPPELEENPATITDAAEKAEDTDPAPLGVAAWDARHELSAYYEALRDRLITHFEVNNMTHKPKLIAVTSCSRGSGVTSTAVGLAATLSETGEGNVLLVDMNLRQGAAHPFYKGKPACGLSDVLESEKRNPAMVGEKLYLASLNEVADKLPRVLPKRFSHLVPKLKMSDYDYIIFDMPAISQTSVTPKLAAFMDLTLMVIESEKTSRNVVEQATAMLAASRVSSKVVLNKYRRYVPDLLHKEL